MTVPKVKICGITTLADALAAVDCGADALGFVFAPSPRQVNPETVRDITGELPPFVCTVGVFVNSSATEVRETMSLCNLHLAQLHGDEAPEDCAALFPNVIKAFTGGNLPPGEELARYRVAAYMLDKNKREDANDSEPSRLWQLARDLSAHGPVILAGGLTPENVRSAIEAAQPYAVDVSSGVEAAPGRKDHDKLQAFIQAARGANG